MAVSVCTGVLPFNKVIIDGTTIDTDEFVYGSGVMNSTPSDSQVTVADGHIRMDRRAISRDASFQVYNDKSSLNSNVGLSIPVQVFLDTVELYTFCAIVTVNHSDDENVSDISFKSDPDTV